MRKKPLVWTAIALLALLLTVGVSRGQIVSFVVSGVGRLAADDANPLFDDGRMHDLAPTEPFSVLAAGDIAECAPDGALNRLWTNLRYSVGLATQDPGANAGMVATTALLRAHPEMPVLALGDLAYDNGDPEAFAECYDPYWGQAKARTWPVPGNHEYRSFGAYAYFDYWQDRAGPDRAGYYALASDDWLLLALNSETDASGGSPQATWLRGVLDANAGKCIGAFYHRPAYSSVARSGAEAARDLFAILADAGAVFVLNGHNHFYERTKPLGADGRPTPGGTVAFVNGAGGKVTTGPLDRAGFSDRLLTGVPGVLKLTLADRSVDWSYLTGRQPSPDSGTLSCT